MNHKLNVLRGAVCFLLLLAVTACGKGLETANPEPPQPIETSEMNAPEQEPAQPGMDPEVDFDLDFLSDDQELNETLTDPDLPDTDGDGLKDGQEVLQYKTSPLLSDTDGDGLNDFQEVRNGGTSPLLADMPQLSIELFGNPSIDVHYTVGESTKTETVEFVENKEQKEDTDSVKTNLSVENNIKLHTEAEVGTSQWPPSASAKLTTDTTFSQGYFHNTSSNWEQSSVESIQEKYEKLKTQNVEYSEGKLSVALKIANLSAMSIRLKNLIVNVYQPDKTLIGSIKPNTDTWPEGGNLIKPGGSITIILENEKIPAQKVQVIMENPTALIFDVAAYEMFMVDVSGLETNNFDLLSQNVIKQTGMISINYGDGTLERYLVATNVDRKADGSSKGVPLSYVLSDIIGLEYETCPQKDANGSTGLTVLCNVENRATFDDRNDGDDDNGYGFWVVGGTGPQFGVDVTKNFNETLLKPKQSVYLVYFKDSDGDKLFDTEEYLLGTYKNLADSDGDGLTDYEEAAVGWTVKLIDRGKKPYPIYSNPLSPNSDGDGWNDKVEFAHTTDPDIADTDGDNLDDEQDDLPLGTCLVNKQALGLAAWWQPAYDPDNKIYFAEDMWSLDDSNQDGTIMGDYELTKEGQDMAFYAGDVPYFSLNRGLNANNQYIQVNNNQVLELVDQKDFTFAADIIWDGELASGEDRAMLVNKGATFSLYVTKNGAVTFTLFRHVKEVCWTPACDSCCADEYRNINDIQTTKNGIITKGKKHHIVATFIEDRMQIYVDGKLEMDFWTPNQRNTGFGGLETRRDDFLNLITNQDPLVIGNLLEGETSKWPFKGRITNIQFYNAKMIPDNVVKLYKYGLCPATQ